MKKILLFCLIANNSFAACDSLTNAVSIQGIYTSGNFNNYSVGFRTDTKFTKGYNNFEFSTSGKLTEIKTTPTANYSLKEKEAYSNLTYSFSKLNNKFLIFTENEYSYLRKINWRGNLGVGYGFKFLNKNNNIFEVSEAILPERIIYKNKSELTSVRVSTRIKILLNKYPFSLSCITLLQPNLYNDAYVNWSDNMIVRNSTSVSVSVTKQIGIGIINDYVMNTYTYYAKLNNKSYDNSMNFFVKMNF
jgi:hypothetical protein